MKYVCIAVACVFVSLCATPAFAQEEVEKAREVSVKLRRQVLSASLAAHKEALLRTNPGAIACEYVADPLLLEDELKKKDLLIKELNTRHEQDQTIIRTKVKSKVPVIEGNFNNVLCRTLRSNACLRSWSSWRSGPRTLLRRMRLWVQSKLRNKII